LHPGYDGNCPSFFLGIYSFSSYSGPISSTDPNWAGFLALAGVLSLDINPGNAGLLTLVTYDAPYQQIYDFTIDPISLAITANFVNPDGSAPPTYFVMEPENESSAIYVTDNVADFQSANPGSSQVYAMFLPIVV